MPDRAYSILRSPTSLPVYADTLDDAVTALFRITKADPTVTCMPYIAHGNGMALSDAEEARVDAIMDATDYDAIEV